MVFLFALFFSSLFCYVKSVMTLNVQFTYGSAVVCFNGFSFLFSLKSLFHLVGSLTVFAGKYLIPFTCLWLA